MDLHALPSLQLRLFFAGRFVKRGNTREKMRNKVREITTYTHSCPSLSTPFNFKAYSPPFIPNWAISKLFPIAQPRLLGNDKENMW